VRVVCVLVIIWTDSFLLPREKEGDIPVFAEEIPLVFARVRVLRVLRVLFILDTSPSVTPTSVAVFVSGTAVTVSLVPTTPTTTATGLLVFSSTDFLFRSHLPLPPVDDVCRVVDGVVPVSLALTEAPKLLFTAGAGAGDP
jgi:hypothetical protein